MRKRKLQKQLESLQMYLESLNALLHGNGFSEAFVLEKNEFEGKEFYNLVLHHKMDKEKAIVFVDDGDEVTLYYLGTHSHIYADTFDETVKEVFKEVREVIQNKAVGFLELDSKGNWLMSGTRTLLCDVNDIEYTDKERACLAEKNIQFELWSGAATENTKLFVIGSTYTDLPAIKEKWSDYFDEE